VKPAPFVPVIGAISPGEASEVPGLEETISYWTEGTLSAEEWLRQLHRYCGTAGFVVRRGEDTLGFVLYGPREHLPRAGRYPLGPLDEGAVLLAYVGGDPRTRRRLLVRMLRDLRHRGVGRVEAIASDRGLPHHVPTPVLLESGWRPVRRAPYRRSYYTLVRTDLGSAVEVGEMARALIGRVKLPGLKKPVPAPGGALSHMSHESHAAGARGGG
jgi:hypothetical protein